MSSVTLSFREFKAGFFDRAEVRKRADRLRLAAESKLAAFVRTRARSSIRSRKKSSTPGQPPSSHEGSLKRLIFFARDPATESTVVGPVAFGKGAAPGLLERGGRTTLRRGGRQRPATYRAFPFMAPAGRAEAKRFPQILREMVR